MLSCYKFDVIQDPEEGGGSFSFPQNKITIGTKYLEKDPHSVWMVICHEVFEAAMTALNYRYADPSVEGNWKFFMDHKEFENVVTIASYALSQFVVQADDTPAETIVGEAN